MLPLRVKLPLAFHRCSAALFAPFLKIHCHDANQISTLACHLLQLVPVTAQWHLRYSAKAPDRVMICILNRHGSPQFLHQKNRPYFTLSRAKPSMVKAAFNNSNSKPNV